MVKCHEHAKIQKKIDDDDDDRTLYTNSLYISIKNRMFIINRVC